MEQTPELDIKRYLSLVVKRRYLFAGAAAALISAIVAVSYTIKPVYEAKTVVSVEKSFLNDLMRGLSVTPSQDDKANALSTIMKSRTLVFKVISDMDLDLNRKTELEVEAIIENFQKKTDIKIEFNRSSARRDIDFFTVSFRHGNPNIARDYVNTLVSRYIEGSLGSKREGSVGANRFLLDQINHYRSKASSLDAEISSLAKDPEVAKYDKLVELQKRLADMSIQYTENHPEVMKLKAEIDSLKAETATGSKADSKAGALSGASMRTRIAALERERDSHRRILEDLSAAFSKSEVSTQAELQDKAGTFRIVDPAVLPHKPVGLDRVKIMLLGIIGGLAGSFGLLVLLDMTDKSVKSVDPLRSLGIIPVLAVIPMMPDPAEAKKTRKKDALLYGCSGAYAVLLAFIIIREVLG